ncbi:hypothetical protein ACHWQZ_G016567 [Mnemiopsis leidyi]
MRLIFLLLTVFLLPSFSYTTGETCNILNEVIPNRVLRPDWPKNDVCRYRETPHCCTRSVETIMKGYANTYAHSLFFSHLMQMRDSTSKLYHSMQNFELPYMSEDLRSTALQYKLVDNLTTRRETLVRQASLEHMQIYYDMKTMPKFCQKNLVEDMEPAISAYLQELVFSHELVESNWNVAKDLFAVVFSSQFTPHCITELIRSGMTTVSCKTCTDHTVRIPTCFNYCTEVVSSCLEPYTPVIELINQWFNLHVQVQSKINNYTHKDRFMRLKDELNILIDREFEDPHYADVCAFHFEDRVSLKNNEYEYNIADSSHNRRRRRLAKTIPPTQFFSTRPLTFPTTTVTPPLLPTVSGNQLFDPLMICYNATTTGVATVSNTGCWNGTGIGDFHRSRIPTTESTPSNMFDIHVSRLQSKMNDLKESLSREFVIAEPETDNNVEKVINPKNVGHGPNFKTVTILIIVMTWITLIV